MTESSGFTRRHFLTVERDIGTMEPGSMIRIEWRGKAIFIVRRTEAMLDKLAGIADLLADPNSEETEQQPEYAMNVYRSSRREFLVVEGVCTHLGCAPVQRFELGPADLGADWPGGFFCPCHGSKFDLAGRVFKGVPAPKNLKVPPYRYVNNTTILIGVDQGAT
jgi:ubiquinol-cytochrome c reductase iron-sulfur subunit